jgi:2-polyprenyl-3-methyl-5-hydroxy-6-metoxy-1,4-benzoquinol methylase
MKRPARIENGLVVGTSGDKYQSKNPIARRLVAGFDAAVTDLAVQASPGTVLEIGCGEGHVVELLLAATSAQIHATDIAASCIVQARASIGSPRVTFSVADLMLMPPQPCAPDLVVCCEVLEHLSDPRAGLAALLALEANWYLLSVPREPIWRALNFVRGAYVADWGNSPGHLQHWSRGGFLKLVEEYLQPVAIRSPLPWTVVLCRRKP